MRVVVDVWGGPDAGPNVWQARCVVDVEDALVLARVELAAGHYVVMVSAEEVDDVVEFDYRTQGVQH